MEGRRLDSLRHAGLVETATGSAGRFCLGAASVEKAAACRRTLKWFAMRIDVRD
jgi:hypothetical protein